MSTAGFFILVVFGGKTLVLAIAGAFLAGFGAPPLEACLRALWPDLLREHLVQSGYALDVASQELIFVTGL
jgi:hypothetical protein